MAGVCHASMHVVQNGGLRMWAHCTVAQPEVQSCSCLGTHVTGPRHARRAVWLLGIHLQEDTARFS